MNMKPEKTLKLTEKIMREQGLHKSGWTAKLDNAKNRFGQCHYGRKTISISRIYAELNSEERVRRTIIHEVAHACAGHGVGHGSLWRELVFFLGGVPKRCFDESDTICPKPRYLLKCPGCGREENMHRKPSRPVACGTCCKGRYQEEYRYAVTERGGDNE